MANFEDTLREAIRAELPTALAPIVEMLKALAAVQPVTLVSVEQAAERFGVSPATIRRRLESHALAGEKIGPEPADGQKDRRRWRVNLAATSRPASAGDAGNIRKLADEARR